MAQGEPALTKSLGGPARGRTPSASPDIPPLVSGHVRLHAPAKLTVSLHVEGVRHDGYHLLRSEMVSIDLADILDLDPDGAGLELLTEGRPAHTDARTHPLTTGPDNLVTRALALVGRTAAVRLQKRISVGGGLGGGSTDAAAILRWAGCLETDQAVKLGADVPFCVAGGRAMVSGVGERVEPLPFEERTFLLLVPPFGVNTTAVYRAWDELAEAGGPVGEGNNHLTAAALAIEPRLARWGEALTERTGLQAQLAGSGSTWFVETTAGRDGEGQADNIASTNIEIEDGTARLITAHAVPANWPRDSP